MRVPFGPNGRFNDCLPTGGVTPATPTSQAIKAIQATPTAQKMMRTERAAAALAALYMDVVPKAMREFRKEMRGSRSDGLTIPQYRILARLDFEDSNNRALAEQLGVSVAAMSRMIDWLSDRELVERTKQDYGDRRMVKVRLTRKGRQNFAKFRKEARARLQKRFAALDIHAQENLNVGLSALVKAVNQMGQVI